MDFIRNVQVELLKTKRSAASWLCLAGGFFIPLLYLTGFIKDHSSINNYKQGTDIWKAYFFQIWQFMAIFLLPLGIVLASSLIIQIESRNNTWKQLHTTPQPLSVHYFGKLLAIIFMALRFFVFFNIGILLSAAIPCLLFDHHWPRQALPVTFFLKNNALVFITCLPIIAIQYIVSLNFKNFMVPLGFGIIMVLTTLMLLNKWQYAYIMPYSYTSFFIQHDEAFLKRINIYAFSVVYFVVFIAAGYYLYIIKREKS